MILNQLFPQLQGAVNEQLLLLLQLISPSVMAGANTCSASPHHCPPPNLFDQLRSATLSSYGREGGFSSSWLNSSATSARNIQTNVPPLENTKQVHSNQAGAASPVIPVAVAGMSTGSPSHVRGQDIDFIPFSVATALETLSNGSLQKVLEFVLHLLQNRRVTRTQAAHSAPISSSFVLKALEEAARAPTLRHLYEQLPDQMPPGPDGATLASNHLVVVKSDDTLDLSATTSQNRPNQCNLRSGEWTTLEHAMFLKGLDEVGPGRWKDISLLVGTRTADQTRSHGQKYFKKLKRKLLKRKSASKQEDQRKNSTAVNSLNKHQKTL